MGISPGYTANRRGNAAMPPPPPLLLLLHCYRFLEDIQIYLLYCNENQCCGAGAAQSRCRSDFDSGSGSTYYRKSNKIGQLLRLNELK